MAAMLAACHTIELGEWQRLTCVGRSRLVHGQGRRLAHRQSRSARSLACLVTVQLGHDSGRQQRLPGG